MSADDATEDVRLFEPEPWVERATCRTVPIADRDRLFFPGVGAPSKDRAEALAMCAVCPVREECLDHALQVPEKYGIWGGTSERQRRVLRRQLGISGQQRKPIGHGTDRGYEQHRRRGENACAACLAAHAVRVAEYQQWKRDNLGGAA